MSERPRVYFSVPEKHDFQRQLDSWDLNWTLAGKEWDTFRFELNLPPKAVCVILNTRLVGFTTNPSYTMVEFVHEHSDVWRWVKARGFDYATPRRSAAGKPLAARLDAMPPRGFSQGMIEEFFGIDGLWVEGLAIVSITLRRPKDKPPMLGVPWTMYQKHKDAFKGLKEMTSSQVAAVIDTDEAT